MNPYDREKLIYAIEHQLCPECCTELDYYSYHERDSTYDERFCLKCNWRVLVSEWENIKEEENLEDGCKREE